MTRQNELPLVIHLQLPPIIISIFSNTGLPLATRATGRPPRSDGARAQPPHPIDGGGALGAGPCQNAPPGPSGAPKRAREARLGPDSHAPRAARAPGARPAWTASPPGLDRLEQGTGGARLRGDTPYPGPASARRTA
eukprot:scaffold2261_cov405-Prasinococcus_capsulatus_cf.AAC.46